MRAKLVLTGMLVFCVQSDALEEVYVGGGQRRIEYNSVVQSEERSTWSSRRNEINDHAFSIELMGRGLIYSLNYDVILRENMAAGIGFSHLSASLMSSFITFDAKATFIPIYVNFYSSEEQHRTMFTAGLSLLNLELENPSGFGGDNMFLSLIPISDMTVRTAAAIPNVGVGYEFRSRRGPMVRVSAYAFYTNKIQPWIGTSFGGNF